MNFNLLLSSTPDFPQAVCAKSYDPDLWFPETNAQLKADIKVIKLLCASCPHRIECAQFAIDEDIQEGVWGGLTPRERTALRGAGPRKRRISNAGERIAVMKANGMTYRQIADVMEMTPNAAQAAYLRHKSRNEASA